MGKNNNSVEFERAFEALFNLKNKEDKPPKKRKNINKETYWYCKYLDAGMEGMKCSKSFGDKNHNCLHYDGYECNYYEPNIELSEREAMLLKEFAERIKMLFYYHFDEIIPSIMADEIDKLLKEEYKIEK